MITLVAGTRPNFMKIAPIARALARSNLAYRLVHTGQHYDEQMSEVFFRDLGMRTPDMNLHAGSGSQAEQTAAVVLGMERELKAIRPDVMVVVGDVTSTLAAALAAAKLGIPVAHVEAGLRSRDWTMPEEINRVLTDQLADILLTPSRDAYVNLEREGIPQERIIFVGNVMIDSLVNAMSSPTDVLKREGLTSGEYALATLHRPANVDSLPMLEKTIAALAAIGHFLPVLFPVHPRTWESMQRFGIGDDVLSCQGVRLVPPAGYNDFVTLMTNARLVATDSGGIQEETTALRIPCLTLRESTERPVTVTVGSNSVVGLDVRAITSEVEAILAGAGKRGSVPEGWDGQAAARIASALLQFLGGTPPARAGRASREDVRL